MDQGNNIPYTHMGPSDLSLSSNSLIAEHVMITNVPCVTWDATIDIVIAEQAQAWAASRTNFGRNCDQNMDPKKMQKLILRRIESKRSRLRKKMYMASLEVKAKEIEDEIVYNLRPQIESEQDQKDSLLLEKETIIHRTNILEKELLQKIALTEKLLEELNEWNGIYTMQQAQMLNWNGYNVEQISNDSFSNYDSVPCEQGPNGSLVWTSTSDEHEANVTDWTNMGLMEMFSTPTSNNTFP